MARQVSQKPLSVLYSITRKKPLHLMVMNNLTSWQSRGRYRLWSSYSVFKVVVGGKNKYLINGTNATNTRVHDLFHSVQLNVNNPHFLIMQGRITKVLNMKPPEVSFLLQQFNISRSFLFWKRQPVQNCTKTRRKLHWKLSKRKTASYERLNAFWKKT